MTRKEEIRLNAMFNRLHALGINWDDAQSLRRIAMTLDRWHELECGAVDGQVTYSIERDGDEPTSPPYLRIQYPTANGYVDRRYRTPDRETGALKRLGLIMSQYPELAYYVQGDPRGLPLYIGKREDMSLFRRGARVTTQKEIRAAFWQGFPKGHPWRKKLRNGDYCTDLRVEFCDFVEMLARDGIISEELAARVTLEPSSRARRNP